MAFKRATNTSTHAACQWAQLSPHLNLPDSKVLANLNLQILPSIRKSIMQTIIKTQFLPISSFLMHFV